MRTIDRLKGMETILLSAFPGLRDEQVRFLLDRANGNPRLLREIILELEGESYYFEDERFDQPLTEEAIDIMAGESFALHDVQKRRYRQLSDELKQLLSYAAYQGMTFIKDLVLEVSVEVDEKQPDASETSLRSAIYPYALLAERSAVIYEFRHRVFHDLASERVRRVSKVRRNLANALVSVGHRWFHSDRLTGLTSTGQETFYLLMLRHTEQGSTPEHFRLQLLAGLVELYHYLGLYARAKPWCDALLAAWPVEDGLSVEVVSMNTQQHVAACLDELGEYDAALSLYAFLRASAEAALENATERPAILRLQYVVMSRAGDVLVKQGAFDGAFELRKAGYEVAQRLVSEEGETDAALHNLLMAQESLADMHERYDNGKEALELYRTNLDGHKRRLRKFGESMEALWGLARASESLGDALLHRDEPEDALALYIESLEIRQTLIEHYGETVELLYDLSVAQSRVGRMLTHFDRLGEALELHEAALANDERAINEFGQTQRRLRSLTISRQTVAHALLQYNKNEVALELFQASIESAQKLLDEYGATADALEGLVAAQEGTSDALQRLNRRDEASKLVDSSLKTSQRIISEFGETPERLRNLSLCLLSVADKHSDSDETEEALQFYVDALKTVERLIQTYGETADRLQNLSTAQSRVAMMYFDLGWADQAQQGFTTCRQIDDHLLVHYGITDERLRRATIARYWPAGTIAEDDPAAAARHLIDGLEINAGRLEHAAHSFDGVASLGHEFLNLMDRLTAKADDQSIEASLAQARQRFSQRLAAAKGSE